MESLPLTSNKQKLDLSPRRFGELKDSTHIVDDPEALQARMAEDGYLLLRGVLHRDEVLAAREEVFTRLAEVGEIDLRYPVIDAISSGASRRKELEDPGLFLKSVCEGPKLRRVTHAGPMMRFHEHFRGGPVRCFDYLWLRVVPVGHATGCHYDVVYMGRGTKQLYTTWTPYGDISKNEGTLMILENSHKIDELLNDYALIDVDKTPGRGGWYSSNPPEVAERFDRRWLTTDFQAGDILVFGMHTMHCSIDNASPVNRLRLSSDSRYQLASDPIDERWIGPNPLAHGRGYGEKRK